MSPVLINGLREGKFHIDYGFPVGIGECYIDPEDFDSMEAWFCLAHDWGLYNLFWWIETQGFRPSPLFRTDNMEEGAAEIYEQYDDMFSIAVYGKVKGYESGSNS